MTEVERVQGLAILLADALCVNTNATKATVKVSNATHKGNLIGDIEVVVNVKQPSTYGKTIPELKEYLAQPRADRWEP